MTNALTIYKDFDGLQRAALALYESKYFTDAKSEAQAIVKVMAGSELGLPPFASMSGIHIIQNKPVLGANVIATLVKNDPRYDYKIITDVADQDTEMYLQWYEDGKEVGVAGFTIKEAQNAGLTGKDNWKKYTSDMLFARAISRGARRFAPGIFGGSPVYTPDEMGADTDEDGFIDATSFTVTEPEPTPEPDQVEDAIKEAGPVLPENGYDFKTRPYDASTLKAALAKKVEKIGAYDASDKQRNLLGALLSEHFQDDTKRYECSEWLFGARSTKDMDGAIVKAALDWLNPQKDDGGAYAIDNLAKTELGTARTASLEASGQETLL